MDAHKLLLLQKKPKKNQNKASSLRTGIKKSFDTQQAPETSLEE